MRMQASVRGALLAAGSGALAAVAAVFVWTFLMRILSTLTVSAPYGWALATGALVGLGVGLFRGQLRNPRMPVLLTGLAAGLAWLVLTGFRPLGTAALSPWTLLGAPLSFVAVSFAVRRVLRDVRLHDPTRNSFDIVLARLLYGAAVLFFCLVVLVPFYFMVASSLKARALMVEDPTNLTFDIFQPLGRLLVGYAEVLFRFQFARYIFNSSLVAVSTVILTLIPAILGAYAVTRLNFPGRRLFSRSILLIYMFPAIVLVIPLYSVFTQLGLRDTLPGLLVVYPAMTIPVALYMLRSYFQTLPRDIEEQGLVDGLTRFQVIYRITIPLSIPALASVGLYVFMIAWNEFLFAFMFLDSPQIFTLSRGMVMLNSQEVPRQYLMAGAVIITVPIMVLFFWFEKYLVSGLTAGGVKG